MPQCTAKSKRSGVQCRNWGMPNGTCRIHGGKTPRGPGLPQFVDGRYSKDLPSHLAARYEQARTDPDLLSLRDQIALVDAFIGELVSQFSSGESISAWKRLWKTRQEAKLVKSADSSALLEQLCILIDEGNDQLHVMQEIGEQIDRSRTLRDSENKRLTQMQLMISAERASVLLGAVVSIVMTALQAHVSNDKLRRRIYADISRNFESRLGAGPRDAAVPLPH